MKRLFTILMAICFVVTVSAQQELQKTAQNVQSSNRIEKAEFPPMPKSNARIILRAGDVWGDGSGYQMLLDATHLLYGTTIPAEGALTASGDVDASIYAQFSHKIPANADGALTTTNIIINSEGYVDVPAGTFDYCITNPTPGQKMWIASGDYGRRDDISFTANVYYIFDVTMNTSTGNDQVTMTTSALSINEVETTDLLIYPNPAKSSLNISSFSNIQRVEIFNLVGQLIATESYNAENVNINISDLSNGLYIAKVTTTDGTMTKKFNVVK